MVRVSITFIKANARQLRNSQTLVIMYEGRPINKLQKGIIQLIFKI